MKQIKILKYFISLQTITAKTPLLKHNKFIQNHIEESFVLERNNKVYH